MNSEKFAAALLILTFNIEIRGLERKADGEMEGKVSAQAWMDNGIVCLFLFVGRVDCFHTQVETQDEIVEVQSNAHTVAHSQIVEQSRELELSAWLVLIVAERPDVSCIDKERPVELPKQKRTVFQVHVELHVACLRDEVDLTVLVLITARSQTTHTPSAHTVGTTSKVTLLKGQHLTVAIGIGDAETGMEYQLTLIALV